MFLACPCCGFNSIEEQIYGSYMLCPICDWEDDQLQLANPCSGGGANYYSLAEQQLKFGKQVDIGTKLYKGYARNPNWRPLNESELSYYQAQSELDPWGNEGVINASNVYWLSNS